MPTAKVRRADGYHCFYCNASVGEDAVKCPGCGRDFARPGPKVDVSYDRSRIRAAFRGRYRSYWLMLIVLGASAVLLSVLFRPRARVRPLLEQPAVPAPAHRVIEIRDVPGPGIDRLSVVGCVGRETLQESLRAVLDWMLYSTLDEHNRQRNRSVRVVWAYVLDDSTAPKSRWRAMAIWTDPRLPGSMRPAGIGGDAVRAGEVEYDFTNSVTAADTGSGKGVAR